ncbi:MAG: nucleotidyltransferase domain-containing protein, partial [Candidatus Omnitrophica bacterium]|nr:nucleotidyltransferase domain-containing protein [Candidatus Omnitrophota bacterium]
NKKSDVDILVSFSKIPDLFEFLRLERYLKELLGIKVDLVTRDALKPIIKQEILKEIVYL